ncbi:FtsX-like permease family protein [Kocuria sp. TGY1127_2]|uniref:FtsX-like permease family protein n=1 Tax=Kocuria sp. TGY1127_2 TaxID=2711328 RepID=UPI0015C0ECBC|nr:FtsX-like permease family protein [Kocuria sp. TGY1127_2]
MNLLFLRKTFSDKGTWGLPVVAFMLTSTVAFIVIGGAKFLMGDTGPNGLLYQFCAFLAVLLLLVPMSTLMSSAGRLMARQRDQRLSTLRLLGATGAQLRLVSVTESGLLALAGIVLGAVAYAALMPLIGLIHLTGHEIGASGLWMGYGWLLPAAALVLALAVGSSISGMRRVEITPLSIRTRSVPRRVRWLRFVAASILFLVAMAVFAGAKQGIGGALIMVFIALALSIPLLAVHLMGPLVLKGIGTIHAKTARTADQLIAARNVLESPQEMWRQVGSIGFSVYVAVILGSGASLTASADSPHADAQEVQLTQDIQTGVIVTLVISFIMVACSVGINQTAQVLDRRDLYIALSRMGMPISQLGRIRRKSVMRPLLAVVVISGLISMVTLFQLIGTEFMTQPTSMVVILATVVFGVCSVWAACAVTTPTLRRVVTE